MQKTKQEKGLLPDPKCKDMPYEARVDDEMAV